MNKNFRFPFSTENLIDAAKELVSVLLLGFLPINLGILLSWLSSVSDVQSFLTEFLTSGEALLLSSALVGPLIYVLLKKYGEFSSLSEAIFGKSNLSRSLSIQFPGGWFFITSIVIICLVAAGVFGHNSASAANSKMLPNNMMVLSSIIFISSIFIFFLVSLIRNNVEDGAVKAYSESTDDFLKEWDEE